MKKQKAKGKVGTQGRDEQSKKGERVDFLNGTLVKQN